MLLPNLFNCQFKLHVKIVSWYIVCVDQEVVAQQIIPLGHKVIHIASHLSFVHIIVAFNIIEFQLSKVIKCVS